MRSSILRRRGGREVDDLRIYRRQGAAPPAAPPDVDSDSESEDEGDLDAPDTPSPTETAFPSGISAPPDSTQPSVVGNIGIIGTETLDTTSSTFTSTSATEGTALPQNNQAQQPDLGQTTTTDQSGMMSRGGVIAMGTIIGLAITATFIFALWRCRRRRKQHTSSKFKPFWLGRDRSQQPGVRAPPPTRRSHSKTMDDLMAAAYAAENGQAYAYGSRPASQQSSDSLWREKQQATEPQTQKKSTSGAGSLYTSQLLTGFWRRGGGGGGDDGMPAAPGQARVPGPAPSVAGKTEMTSQSGATESTWNTWGVMQHHSKPKGNFLEKLRR